MELMTNNPEKIAAMKSMGFEVTRKPLVIDSNKHNILYQKTKVEKLGHLLH